VKISLADKNCLHSGFIMPEQRDQCQSQLSSATSQHITMITLTPSPMQCWLWECQWNQYVI